MHECRSRLEWTTWALLSIPFCGSMRGIHHDDVFIRVVGLDVVAKLERLTPLPLATRSVAQIIVVVGEI
jgi:hypothetical protein